MYCLLLVYDLAPNLSEIFIIKIFAISLLPQPFLAATLDFTSFFTMGGHTLFYNWAVFGFDFTSFCNLCCKAGILPLMTVITCLLFMQTGIWSTLYVYHAYFLKICIYFVHINDCRLIMKQLNKCSSFQYKVTSAINCLLSNFQPSWILREWLTTWMTFI